MATIDEGLQAGKTSEFILLMVKLLLGFFALGMLCRCLFIMLRSITEGKELGEVIRIIQNRLFVIALAASISGILGLIEEAFKNE